MLQTGDVTFFFFFFESKNMRIAFSSRSNKQQEGKQLSNKQICFFFWTKAQENEIQREREREMD